MTTGNENADLAFKHFYEASGDTKNELLHEFNTFFEGAELSMNSALERCVEFDLWLFERYFSFNLNIY